MVNNKLKEIRTKRGMSISELARRSKLSRVTISNIENGLSNPKATTVLSICKTLGKNPNDIFFNISVNQGEREEVKQ